MTNRQEYNKAYYQAHKEEINNKGKSYNKEHKEERYAYKKVWQQEHNEEIKLYKKAYTLNELNSLGQTKASIRKKSWRYLSKFGKKIEGYEIHHCCTYTEPYKFIYCSREIHKLIHAYLRQYNIDADSNHYEYIKHLLDDSAVLYGLER